MPETMRGTETAVQAHGDRIRVVSINDGRGKVVICDVEDKNEMKTKSGDSCLF